METITIEKFWEIVASVDWFNSSKGYAYKDHERRLLREYPTKEQIEQIRDHYHAVRKVLGNKLGKHAGYMEDVEQAPYENGYGGDSWGDMIAEIIGRGKEFYELVIEEPMIAYVMANRDPEKWSELNEKYPQLKAMGKWARYSESFSYALPHSDDVKLLTKEHYINTATKYLDEAENNLEEMIAEKQEELDKLLSLKGSFGVVVTGLKFMQDEKQHDHLSKSCDDIIKHADALSEADVTHYGPQRLFVEFQQFLYGPTDSEFINNKIKKNS